MLPQLEATRETLVQKVQRVQVDIQQWQLVVFPPPRSAQRHPLTLRLIVQEHTLLRAPQWIGTPRPQGRIRAPETETPLPLSWIVQRALKLTWRM